MNLGVTELLIVLAVLLLLFGSTRLPKLARSVGLAKREFEAGEREQTSTVVTHTVVSPDVVSSDAVPPTVVPPTVVVVTEEERP